MAELDPQHSATTLTSPEQWFGDLDRVDFEIDFFSKILARRPHFVPVLRIMGELLSQKGKLAEMLAVDRRLVDLRPQDAVARYNLACGLAQLGETEAALLELDTALELGYADFEHLEVDPDLDSLRDDPRSLQLLRRYSIEKTSS